MRFGFESEKHLYDLSENDIHTGVFRIVDALSDYTHFHGFQVTEKVTNEFVLNMIEINTQPHSSQIGLVEDYLLTYYILKNVAARESVELLPMASVPFSFTPTVVPRWAYYVQNSILEGRRKRSWQLGGDSKLAMAGNCAGLHVHFEVETLPEFLSFGRELMDKHNMGLMLTPLTAFASSPYFWGKHEGFVSMRSQKYYSGVYKDFPDQGSLPPVFQSSEEVLLHFLKGMNSWVASGESIGLNTNDLQTLVGKKGANWSMVRWNRTWNTIELRCLESDRIDLDAAKMVWATAAMSRLGMDSEALQTTVLEIPEGDLANIDFEKVLVVKDSTVSILPTWAIHEITNRSVRMGIKDSFVNQYLLRLSEFCKPAVEPRLNFLFEKLVAILKGESKTTSEVFLEKMHFKPEVTREECKEALSELIKANKAAFHEVADKINFDHKETIQSSFKLPKRASKDRR